MKFTEGDGTPMEDEETKLNEMIRHALSESRRPPEPPLDEMWAQIERRAFDEAPRRIMVAATPAHWSRWTVPALAAAAALLVGVGLGWSIAPRGTVVTRFVPAPVQTVATTQHSAEIPSDDSSNTRSDVRTASASLAESRGTEARAHARPAATGQSIPDLTTARLASQLEDVGGSDMSRYLVRTSALLMSLPSDRTTTQSDTVIANRAADLLTQTHLLLDSRAGSDPTLHRLLEDLELVLAQVARLRVQRSGSDLQLIHQALAVRDVLPRVHDATVEASITD